MSVKMISAILAALGLGALANMLFRKRRRKSSAQEEYLFSSYILYIETGVVSPQLLLLADADLLKAISANSGGRQPVSLEILQAMRASCGSNQLENYSPGELRHLQDTGR